MKCAAHSEVDSAYFCRVCGKPMCTPCTHLIQGQAFCEACLARNVATPGAGAPDMAHPWLAFGLGWIPGVGAVVNGEYTKAVVHIAIFAGTIALLNTNISAPAQAFLGIFLGFFCLYMPFEAYQTARRKQLATQASPGAAQPSITQPQFYQDFWSDWKLNAPVGGIILVIIGVLFLLDNMGFVYFDRIFRFWPLLLIAIGIVMLRKRLGFKD
jgi:hypothetical protein